MISKLYTLQDTATQIFTPIFGVPTDVAAKRVVANSIAQPGHTLSDNPSDFLLFSVGEFDDETGHITTWPPSLVCRAVDVIPSTPKIEA